MSAAEIVGMSSQVLARFQVIGRPAGYCDADDPEWHRMVSAAAYDCAYAIGGALHGPLALETTFRFRMPPKRPRAVLDAGRCHKATAPHTSALVLSVEHSMVSAGLIADRACLAVMWASKIEVLTEWSGCDITIRRL